MTWEFVLSSNLGASIYKKWNKEYKLNPVLILAGNNVLGLIKVKSILKVLVFNYQKSAVWFSSV